MSDPTAQELRLLLDRLDRLYEERDGITADIRDVYAEAAGRGFDTKTIRQARKRRKMAPDDRREADALLETYEAALAGEMDDEESLPDIRPDVTEIAIALLSAQIIGLEDKERGEQLVEHIIWMLDLRAEIALLREHESDRKKLAKAEGFDTNQLSATIRWFEKCAKHGEDKMRAGEAVFGMYRGTVEAHRAAEAVAGGTVSQDDKLQGLFAPKKPEKTNKRARAALDAAALARAARQAGEE